MNIQDQILGVHEPILDRQAELQQWRLELLNGLFLSIFTIGGILVVIASLSAVQNIPDLASIVIPFFIGTYLALGAATFVRRLPYLLRCGVLLGLALALGAYDLNIYGLASDGRFYLFTGSLLTALLIGVRAAAGFAGLSIVTVTMFGWLRHDWVPTTVVAEPNLAFWATQLTSMVLQVSVVLVCLAFIIRRMNAAIDKSHVATRAATASAQQSQQQVEILAAQKERLETVERQLRDLVQSLETPSVDLANQVVLVPLVGAIDSLRIQALTERLITIVHARGIRLMIIDVAGIPVADTESLYGLHTTASALKLLGCRVVFTGFSANLALAFLDLKASFDTIEVMRSPQEVLAQQL